MLDNNGSVAIDELVAKAHDPAGLATALAACHPSDAIEVLNRLAPEDGARVLLAQSAKANAAMFNYPGLDVGPKLVALLPQNRAVALLSELSADRRVELVRHLPEPLQDKLCAQLPAPVQASVRQLLTYPPNRAGGIMTTEFVSLPSTTTVAGALQNLREVAAGKETVYAIYLLDPASGVLTGVVSLRELILADPAATLASIAHVRKPITVTTDVDREDVARLISKYDLLAVPAGEER